VTDGSDRAFEFDVALSFAGEDRAYVALKMPPTNVLPCLGVQGPVQSQARPDVQSDDRRPRVGVISWRNETTGCQRPVATRRDGTRSGRHPDLPKSGCKHG